MLELRWQKPGQLLLSDLHRPKFGFGEYHATTLDNPVLPKRLPDETFEAWSARRAQYLEELRRDNDALVYEQEYLAEFVDWSGVAFFAREKLLDQGQPLPMPTRCHGVFAVIDTASKTGTEQEPDTTRPFLSSEVRTEAFLTIVLRKICRMQDIPHSRSHISRIL
jgi:hypothetical protein